MHELYADLRVSEERGEGPAGSGKRSATDLLRDASRARRAGSEISCEDVARLVTLRLGVIPVGPSARLVEHRKQRQEERDGALGALVLVHPARLEAIPAARR